MERPVRKSPRLKNYDYSLCGAYFLTICTHHHQHLLGKIDLGSEKKLFDYSEVGFIILNTLEQLQTRFPEFEILNFSILPNHLHILLLKTDLCSKIDHTVSDFVCALKSLATKEIRVIHPGMKVWQESFHDHIIRNEKDLAKHWDYIDQNVNNWQKDQLFNEKERPSRLHMQTPP